MEKLVMFLCGLWLWLTGKRRSATYREGANTLHAARLYLISDYASRASTQERGHLLPDQVEALTILERQVDLADRTARRFESLTECYRIAIEELSQPEPETQKAA